MRFLDQGHRQKLNHLATSMLHELRVNHLALMCHLGAFLGQLRQGFRILLDFSLPDDLGEYLLFRWCSGLRIVIDFRNGRSGWLDASLAEVAGTGFIVDQAG